MWGAIRSATARATSLFQSGGSEALTQEAERLQLQMDDFEAQAAQEDGADSGQSRWGARWIFGKLKSAVSSAASGLSGLVGGDRNAILLLGAVILGSVVVALMSSFGGYPFMLGFLRLAKQWVSGDLKAAAVSAGTYGAGAAVANAPMNTAYSAADALAARNQAMVAQPRAPMEDEWDQFDL
jgi:hypothetical protein